MRLYKFLLGVAVCFTSLVSYAGDDDIKGIVKKVIDGNTIEVANDSETYKVLLHGIDSPDPGQEYAEQSKRLLEKLLLNKSITIMIKGKDRFGNRIGEIQIDGAINPTYELVKEGLAWTAERNPVSELETLKEQARLEGKGLWQQSNPTPPWIYRRQQSMLQPKISG